MSSDELPEDTFNMSLTKPPCSCKICLNSFKDPAAEPSKGGLHKLTDEESVSVAAGHLTSINRDLEYLRKQWKEHGKIIVSRWKKRTREKRVGILKKADPDLIEQQWFMARFTTKQLGATDEFKALNFRKSILLDYLSIDGLKSDPAKLIGLVQNRCRYGPEQWSSYDNQRLDWAWRMGIIDFCSSGMCMVMYGSHYGELVPWDARAAHAGRIIGFSRAELVLEAQETLFQFLHKVVEQLVEGLSEPESEPATVPHFEIDLKRSGRVELWSTSINEPFSAPPSFDIDIMLRKATASLNAMDDHLWLMQTNPTYLRRTIYKAVDGYPEQKQPKNIQGHIINDIHIWVWSYWSWHAIVEALQNTKELHTQFKDDIHPGAPLPPTYEASLQELEMLLESQLRLRYQALPLLQSERFYFQRLFKFESTSPDSIGPTGIIDIPDPLKNEPLFYALNVLYTEPDSKELENYDMGTKWAFLEDHLATSTPEAAGRLDEGLYDHFTDYAAVQDLFKSTHTHLPAPPWLEELDSYSLEQAKSLGRPTVFHHQIEKILEEMYRFAHANDSANDSAKVLSMFTKMFDNYAAADVNDEELLTRFDMSWAQLRAFWGKFRRERTAVFKYKPKIWTKSEVDKDLKVISVDLEPEWKEMILAERQKLMDEIEKAKGSIVDYAGISTNSSKNRRDRLPAIDALSMEPSARIVVKASTLRIVNMMCSTTAEPASKLVNWDDFVLAMQDIGFLARQTVGREVAFSAEEGNKGKWTGQINFNRPHPAAKIERLMMRVMGERMERWFGWKEGMFVVKK
ncbi:hypothetical protein BJ875DRAFT_479170 [Amylocarpus encephaloides]|uniref:Clr5 domain-containing protein n=1 Tax=Amylocarpus encephaloides TaxID=45428 RepID=A0A9P7YTN5_9HELO|nr:hypothetical protein BJ875DRAFT_479170 [Amylocarpus encephaloides]